MYTLELSDMDLSEIIMTLEIEKYRIEQYHAALEKLGQPKWPYDTERAHKLEVLAQKLRKVRGH